MPFPLTINKLFWEKEENIPVEWFLYTSLPKYLFSLTRRPTYTGSDYNNKMKKKFLIFFLFADISCTTFISHTIGVLKVAVWAFSKYSNIGVNHSFLSGQPTYEWNITRISIIRYVCKVHHVILVILLCFPSLPFP